MASLAPDLMHALRNLALKERGEEVDWISIACARKLTDLGLAERNAGGWNITAAGSATLMSQDLSGSPDPIPFPKP